MTTEAKRTEDSSDVGRRFRYGHLQLRLVLRDLYFSRDDPGQGDRVPDFDLPTFGGGRFRSTDLGETRPALLIFGSALPPVLDRAGSGAWSDMRRVERTPGDDCVQGSSRRPTCDAPLRPRYTVRKNRPSPERSLWPR